MIIRTSTAMMTMMALY